MKKIITQISKIISFSRIAILIIILFFIVGGILFLVSCDFFNQETTVESILNCWSESESKDTQDHSYQKKDEVPVAPNELHTIPKRA